MNKLEIITSVIRQRRSTYANDYKKKKVPRKILKEILTNSIWAPTHKMTEPWHFIILENTEIDKFGKYMAEFYKNDYPKRYQSFLSYPVNAAYIIVIMMERNQHKSIPEWEEIAAVSCSVQNMWLSCQAYGLGAYWDSSAACIEYGTTLKVNDNQKCLGFFYMGYPNSSKPLGKRKRKSLSVKTTWLTAEQPQIKPFE